MECLSEGGRVVTLTSRTVRCRRTARHPRAREGQRPDHRRRRVRQAHPGRPRRRPRAVGPHQPRRHHLLGRDVVRGDQAAAARPPRRHAADRRLLVVGGARHGQFGLVGRVRRPDGAVPPRARGPGHRPRRPRHRARLRRGRGAGPRGAQPRRLLQGRSQDGRHVPDHRRGAVLGARRLRARSTPTVRSTCSAAGRCASTPAARRSIPRRSRRSSRPSTASSTPSWSVSRTNASARRSSPSSSSVPASRPDRSPPTPSSNA